MIRIAFVVAVLNDYDRLRRTLKSLNKLFLPTDRIVLVNSGELPLKAQLSEEFSFLSESIKEIICMPSGVYNAHALGAKNCECSYIIFLNCGDLMSRAITRTALEAELCQANGKSVLFRFTMHFNCSARLLLFSQSTFNHQALVYNRDLCQHYIQHIKKHYHHPDCTSYDSARLRGDVCDSSLVLSTIEQPNVSARHQHTIRSIQYNISKCRLDKALVLALGLLCRFSLKPNAYTLVYQYTKVLLGRATLIT